MSNEATVAIITRTKNRPLLLERAMKSVLGQDYSHWQHIIVNDGGDPGPVDELVSKHAADYGSRVKVIHNNQSVGMEAASNIGLHNSEGKYVTIHDDDDSWEVNFLSRCIDELNANIFPSVKGVVTHTNQIFERIEGKAVVEERRQDFDADLTAVSLPQISEINKFMPISFLYERSVFDQIGMYDESLPVIGDWEFNIRYFTRFDVLVIKENLANYHIRDSVTDTYSNTVTAGKDRHVFYRALIVNKHLRADMENGSITVGGLLALGDYFYRVGGGFWRINRILDKLKSLGPIKLLRRLTKK